MTARSDDNVRIVLVSIIVIALAVILAISLSGCDTVKQAVEPLIVTKIVKVEVPIPCKTDIDLTEQVYPDTKAAIAAAPTVFEKGQLVLAANQLRAARLALLEPAFRACVQPK